MAKITKSQLIKLQKKLKTDAAIGDQFGITRQAVHQLRKKYGIESSIANNPERNAQIVDLYESGTSGTALAKKYKLSVSQTYRIINEAKAKTKKSKAKAAKKTKKAAKPAKKTAKKATKKKRK
ncbi:MAG: helix-turn-helix domain-containing protein [Chitinispirillaceae bacterium]